MATFSERMGYLTPREAVQIDDIDDALRTRLWNTFHILVLSGASVNNGYIDETGAVFRFLRLAWINYFNRPIDTLSSYWDPTYKWLREWFFGEEWFRIYDFIEFLVQNFPDETIRPVLAAGFNSSLQVELSGYRVVDLRIVRITSQEEIGAIESAIQSGTSNEPHVVHLSQALSLYSDRSAPDYRNSVKESISAVEAACVLVSGNPKADLADALRTLEASSVIHPALKSAFSKMYGWTSDSGGIRHALTDENVPDQTDALFMLVACSAFINYLLGKSTSV
jgi:hypothetical protein